MFKIGLIPVSAKPYHAGHHALVELAARQNDLVKLFVSISDRHRPGEFPIEGEDMARVWQEHLENIMPGNVEVVYGGSPVRKVYEEVGDACKVGSDDVYTIYSDPEDTSSNYSQAYRDKYMQPLYSHGQIKFAAELDPNSFTRGIGTPDISGTKVRICLENGDFNKFQDAMPEGVDAQAIFNILSGKEKDALLKDFVSTIIS